MDTLMDTINEAIDAEIKIDLNEYRNWLEENLGGSLNEFKKEKADEGYG